MVSQAVIENIYPFPRVKTRRPKRGAGVVHRKLAAAHVCGEYRANDNTRAYDRPGILIDIAIVTRS